MKSLVQTLTHSFFLLNKYLFGRSYKAVVVLGYKKAGAVQYCLIYSVHFGRSGFIEVNFTFLYFPVTGDTGHNLTLL